MLAVKFDTDTLRYIVALENSTGAEVKDCIPQDDSIIYVIKKGQLGMAIGKKGVNVKKIGSALGKSIRIIEFSEDPIEFATKMLNNSIIGNISIEEKNEKKNMVIEADYRTRGAILGKKGKKIQILKDILKRHHSIDDVIVR